MEKTGPRPKPPAKSSATSKGAGVGPGITDNRVAGITAWTAAGVVVPDLASPAPDLADRNVVVLEREGEPAEEGLEEGLGAGAEEQALGDAEWGLAAAG